MKKNFSVNIGSRIFNIDEDAYERLNNYLARLKTFFAGDEGCDEIITDIEMRIAELLEQKKSNAIITIENIEEVIANMGEPDELSEGKKEPINVKTAGKLYRDIDNRQIGGVCAGIAAWLGIAPLWVRVILIVFTIFYGSGFIIYLVLWIILPAAKTTSEKLEMHRQSVNIDNLRNEAVTAGKGLKQTGNTLMNSLGTFLRLCTEIISRIIRWAFMFLRRFAGVILIFIALILLGSIGMIFLIRDQLEFGMYHLAPDTLSNAMNWLIPGTSLHILTMISVILLFVGILGLMIFIGLRLLLKWPPIRWLVISLLAICLLSGLIIGGGAMIQFSSTHRTGASTTERQSLMLKNKVIVLESASYDKSNYWVPIEKNGIINNFTEVLANVDLSIRPAASDSLVLTTVKTASGTFETSAFNSARNIKYSYRIKDSLIIIEPYFKFSKKEGMHFQKAEFIIAIPVNTEIQIDEKLCEMLNDEDFTGEDNSGGKYLMTNTGLKKLLTK